MSDAAAGLDAHIVVRRGDFVLDIELDIAPGTTVALLGPNGAGKSTTVEAIAGLLALDAGHIDLDRRRLDDAATGHFVPPEDRRVGVVFQRHLLFDHLSVADNVAFGPRSRGVRRRDAGVEAQRWLETFDLVDLADRRPSQLSGGQAQRVALARALAADPALLLLDEPLAALDVSTRARLRRTLAGPIAAYGGPRLLITHDPTDAFLLADLVVVIEGGRVTQRGTPTQIRQRPATPYVADLAGTNLLIGTADHGRIVLDDHPHVLQAADTTAAGPVLVTVHPSAVALYETEPHGSPRNSWATTVQGIEPLGDITRVSLGAPLPISVDVTPASAEDLGLEPGVPVWAAVKATEISVHPT